MSDAAPASRALHRYAWICVAATLGLISIGGLVTSRGAGLAVPDWPTSYGYNMFALPFHFWQGGIFYEHTHRLWATVVGTLVVFLTRWLGGAPARRPLAILGGVELLAGLALVGFKPELKGAGHFLAGIGGVVLLAAAVWARNAPAPRPLPALGWLALALVQVQGLLGGLRVVWLADELGVVHAVLAQGFLLLLVLVALGTGAGWRRALPAAVPRGLQRLVWIGFGLVVAQLVLGASMRHRHAGLAVPDFPLAHGRLWPRLDAESLAGYNRQRIEVHAARPIEAADVVLHMSHRLGAVAVLGVVVVVVGRARRHLPREHPVRRGAALWLGLVLVQFGLGAWTVWSNKAADIATLHVLVGSLLLAVGGGLGVWSSRRPREAAPVQTAASPTPARPAPVWTSAA